MNHNQLKAAAIQRLYETTGRKLPDDTLMQQICTAIGVRPRTGYTPSRILRDYLGVEPPKPKEVVNPPYRRESFGELSWRPARMDEIDRDQPPMIGIHAEGNGAEPSPVWRR